MASVGGGMTDELRYALRAKHRLVEQMKEDVARPDDRRSARRAPFWQMVTVVAAVLFLSLAAAGGAAAEKATRASRAAAAERRALERREVKRWSSERALRHFGLRQIGQIAFTDPVRTSDNLHDAVRDPDTHVVVAHVSHSTVMGRKRTKGGDGLTWVDRPILADSSYAALDPGDGFDFDGFLARFLASGSNKGLLVSLRDPRVVVPVFKALETAVENGRLVSPIILDAEVLPGPAGTCRGIACVRANSTAYRDHRVRRDGRAALEENDARARDPSTWTTGRDSPSRRRTARATSCRSIPSVSSARRRFASRARFCRSASRRGACRARAKRSRLREKKKPSRGARVPVPIRVRVAPTTTRDDAPASSRREGEDVRQRHRR